MKRNYLSNLALAFVTSAIAFVAQSGEVKNIAIVHGASLHELLKINCRKARPGPTG